MPSPAAAVGGAAFIGPPLTRDQVTPQTRNRTHSFQTPYGGQRNQTHKRLELGILFPQFFDWPGRNILVMIQGRTSLVVEVRLSCGGEFGLHETAKGIAASAT